MRALLLLALIGCSDSRFNVSSEGGVLPVDLRGDPDLGIAVMVDGGPGAGLARRTLGLGSTWQDTVERQLAVAYYDRRGTGNALGSQGDLDDPIGQHERDLLAVIEAVRLRHDPPDIWLISHSNGGYITTSTLAQHDVDIDGWIDVSGALNRKLDEENAATVRLLGDLAAEQIAAGDTDAFWTEVEAFAAEHPEVPPESEIEQRMWDYAIGTHDRILGKPDGEPLSAYLSVGLLSQYSTLDGLIRESAMVRETRAQVDGTDLRPLLADIDVPRVHVVGRYDIPVPPNLLDDIDGDIVEMEHGHWALWRLADTFNDILADFRDETLQGTP